MPQSLAKLHIHLIYSTKNRQRILTDRIRSDLHAYMGAILKNIHCMPILINSVEDHIHVLFDLARTVAPAKAVEESKKSTSKWIKTQGPEFVAFAWQAGYAAFGVSESIVPSVCKYISGQKEHHRQVTFQDEYRLFVKKHKLDCDE